MSTKTAYRSGVALAVFAALFLVWLMGAVGVLGIEGDPADRMYLGVLAIGIVGALASRFRPRGMAVAMVAVAIALAGVAAIALIQGKHEPEYTSVPEILGLNGMFAMLFLGAAWLFRKAARGPTAEG